MTAPGKIKLFLKPKFKSGGRSGRRSSSFNRRVAEERARIEKINTQLRLSGLPVEKFAGESFLLKTNRLVAEKARIQAQEVSRRQTELKRQADIIQRRMKQSRMSKQAFLDKQRQLRRIFLEKSKLLIKPVVKFKKIIKKIPTEKQRTEFFFGRVLATKEKGVGLKVQPEFSRGEKFSLRTANLYAGVELDKFLRRNKKYKKFSDDIDKKVNSNKVSKFAKDNILHPIAEDIITLAATSPFLKSTTALKNEFLLDEIRSLNKHTARQMSLGLKKAGKGNVDEIILASTKTSKNFKINTLTRYKVAKVGGKRVLIREGKGMSGLFNKRTGEQIGKPIEFTFFGKGKAGQGRFVQVGKEGEKVISGLGKSKIGTGQVKILTKDLKVINSRFGALFRNHKGVEFSLSGKVDKAVAPIIKFKDIKIKGFKQSKIKPTLSNLLKMTNKKVRLLGTKKSVRLDVNDLAVIRKFSPKSYSRILRGKGTRVIGRGKNIVVTIKRQDLGGSFGQVVSKEIENLLSGGVSKGIQFSKSIDRIIKNTIGKGISKGVSVTKKAVKVVPDKKKETDTTTTTTTTTATTTAFEPTVAVTTTSKGKGKKKKSGNDVATKPVTVTKPITEPATKKKAAPKAKAKVRVINSSIIPRIRLKIKAKPGKILGSLKRKKRRRVIKKVKKGVGSFNVSSKPIRTLSGKKAKRSIRVNKVPLTKLHAKNLRNYITDTSLSRKASIRPTRGKPKRSRLKVPAGYAKKTAFKFRKFKTVKGKRRALPKGTVIEKRRYLLDTRQEKNKISLRRRIKQITIKKKVVRKKLIRRRPVRRKVVRKSPIRRRPVRRKVVRKSPIRRRPVKRRIVRKVPIKRQPIKRRRSKRR